MTLLNILQIHWNKLNLIKCPGQIAITIVDIQFDGTSFVMTETEMKQRCPLWIHVIPHKEMYNTEILDYWN